MPGERHGEEVARQEEARRRVREALASQHPEARLSDVFHDAHDYSIHEAHDGIVFDGPEDHGYDADDLAAVLLPVLTAAYSGRERPSPQPPACEVSGP